MPLLAEDSAISEEQLAKILRDHRMEITGIIEQMRSPEFAGGPPYRFETAVDLGRQVLAVSALAERPGAPRELRIATGNLGQAVLLAIVDLFKTHGGLPRVPGGRREPAAPPPGNDRPA